MWVKQEVQPFAKSFGKCRDQGKRWAALAVEEPAHGGFGDAGISRQARLAFEGITGSMRHEGADAVGNGTHVDSNYGRVNRLSGRTGKHSVHKT